jgi:hypothetical protein
MLAIGFLRLQNRQDEAMALFEKVFEAVKDNKYTSTHWYLRKRAIERLSQLYFDKAGEAEEKGEVSDEWIAKLRTMRRAKP